ncbi:UDP-N-acetylmuramate dehydrogenase [Leeuwenhoekiella sp. A16]|uniref:UDP-N-acetylmuramate dehydrogenase n=1 Tax=unclassified Leeuwenhoekiella TaxID=2615029 RepID=UPI003A8052B6
MQIQENISLKPYNTFAIDTKAALFVSVKTEDELKEALSHSTQSKFILGGGSNMLLQRDIDDLVIHINLKGIQTVKEEGDYIFVKVCAGENWHDFVLFSVKNNYGGVENLSLIPGNTGTAPIQNIGAYGVELKDVFESCEVIDRATLAKKSLSLTDCNFGYRDSIFKNEAKDKYVITSVTFKLKKARYEVNTAYGAIKETLVNQNILQPSIKDVSDAVIAIRKAKLPDPAQIGNSGSFFKNPIVSQEIFTAIRDKYETLPYYPLGNEKVKIPAGWLIEQAGFKGKRFGDAGVHDKQALVLVNYGTASGQEIWDLAMRIQREVAQKFNIKLQPEVNIIK